MKYRIMMLTLCSLIFLSLQAQGQYRTAQEFPKTEPLLTGNLQYDMSVEMKNDIGEDSLTPVRKVIYRKKYSPLRAGLFSAVLPGAGQFYTKSYWKSAAFFGAEVLMWVAYATYENSGDRKTAEFEKYADEHWSVVRYAHWIKGSGLTTVYDQFNVIPGEPGVPVSDDIASPWNYVNWEQLNLVEDNISGSGNVTGFTHRLERHGEQQYFEMIGKYAQFGGGWDDAGTFKSDDILTNKVSPKFLAYSNMRGDANSKYTISRTVSYLIVANHIFSALEAAWNASKINNKIKLQGHIQSRRVYGGKMVEFVPTLQFECEL